MTFSASHLYRAYTSACRFCGWVPVSMDVYLVEFNCLGGDEEVALATLILRLHGDEARLLWHEVMFDDA